MQLRVVGSTCLDYIFRLTTRIMAIQLMELSALVVQNQNSVTIRYLSRMIS